MANEVESADAVMLIVENLSSSVNNALLRYVFSPYNAKRCRVVYVEKEHQGT